MKYKNQSVIKKNIAIGISVWTIKFLARSNSIGVIQINEKRKLSIAKVTEISTTIANHTSKV